MQNHYKNTIVLIIFFCFIFNTKLNSQDNDDKFQYYYNKAEIFKNRNNDSIVYYADKAYNIASLNKNINHQLDALFVKIKSDVKSGRIIMALQNCNLSKKIIEENIESPRRTEVEAYFGMVYYAMGFSSEALKYFIEAINGLESDFSDHYKKDLYYYIALVYYDMGEFEKCQYYVKMSISAAINSNNLKDTFASYLVLSNTFTEVDSIQHYIQLAKQVIDSFPDLAYEKVVLLNNQAILDKAIGKLKESKISYIEAISLADKNDFEPYLGTLYNNYAYLLMAEAKYDSAKYYLDRGLEIAININNLDLESEIYDSYSDYYQRINDFEQALEYADLFTEKRNEYREQQRVQESLFLSAIFETEQKEKEILQQENQISHLWMIMMGVLFVLALSIGLLLYFRQKNSLTRSRLDSMKKGKALELADALLQGQDAERKRLAMDLHDGLGARLASLRFLVDGFFKKNEKYGEVMGAILHINQNVRELSHRMLPAQLDDHGLVLSINNLIASINKSGRFRLLFETNLENRLDNKLEINLYYLIFELINNATKHSKGDTIVVQLLEHDDAFNLSVEDNGGGFVTTSTNGGMGLKNIQTRVDYLSGEMAIESNDTETSFLIVIPKQLP